MFQADAARDSEIVRPHLPVCHEDNVDVPDRMAGRLRKSLAVNDSLEEMFVAFDQSESFVDAADHSIRR